MFRFCCLLVNASPSLFSPFCWVDHGAKPSFWSSSSSSKQVHWSGSWVQTKASCTYCSARDPKVVTWYCSALSLSLSLSHTHTHTPHMHTRMLCHTPHTQACLALPSLICVTRLDKKKLPYDLVWKDDEELSGKVK